MRPPLRRLPALGHVDRLSRDPVPAKLEDADPEAHGTIVVGDRDLGDPEITLASDLLDLEGRGRRIAASPFPEVLDADEALAGLGELEDGVVVVHLVGEPGSLPAFSKCCSSIALTVAASIRPSPRSSPGRPRSSSRFAAARIGSTWSGRRKPTIAPSTAGLRSVQATATAPGVVPWRSATARRRSTRARCSREQRLLEARVVLAPVVVRQARDPLAGHRAGEQPGAHRRVDDDADALALGEGQDLRLDLARDQRVRRLEGLDRRDRLRAAQLRDVEVRDADVADEALAPSARRASSSPPRCPRRGSGQWIW